MANVPNSFSNMEDILNNTRAIVNDAYNAGAGEILTDIAPFTLQYINSSLLELQDRLGNNAEVSLMIDNYIVSGLEAVNNNPTLQTSLGYNGYTGYTNTFTITQVQVSGANVVTVTCLSTSGLVPTMPVVISGLTGATFLNGQTLIVGTVTPTTFTAAFTNATYGPTADSGLAINTLDPTLVLPPDLLSPEFLWERQTGQNLPFHPMRQPMEGLPSRLQGPTLNEWEWRNNAIWFIGATTLRDVRIRYRRLEANIPEGTDYTTVYVDLPGAANALAYLIGYRYVMSRNPETAQLMRAAADYHILQIIKRAVRQKQGIEYRRKDYGNQHQRRGYANRVM